MAIGGDTRARIREAKVSGMGELGIIDEQTRKVQCGTAGPTVNLTDIGRRFHDIAQSDEVRVVVCDSGWWIEPVGEGDE